MWMRTIADAAKRLDALTNPKLQELAWSKQGSRGPLRTVATGADAIARRAPAETEAVLPMPSADVMLALFAQMEG